jgi:cytoskeletal protein RodZ
MQRESPSGSPTTIFHSLFFSDPPPGVSYSCATPSARQILEHSGEHGSLFEAADYPSVRSKLRRMPETRGERAFFIVGLVAIVLLAAVVAWERATADAQPGPVAAAAQKISASTPSATTTTNSTTAVTTSAARAHPPATRPAATQLQLTARSDTWVSVRKTSRTGPVLFEGTMASGDTRRFTGGSLSVRFGAAANVEATLNGRPLPLPGGTYSVQIGRSGLGPRSA